jgi:UDP-N-acetylmuramate dehydrogenase
LNPHKKNDIPWFLLGRGSNVLFSDDNLDVCIIKLGQGFKGITFDDKTQTVTVGAATMLPKLATVCAQRGMSGLECVCDIPGTVGAAIRINAGTKEGEIANLFVSARVLDDHGEIHTLNADEMKFGYRSSILMGNRWIVLDTCFRYGPQKLSEEILETMRAHRKVRKSKQPTNSKNCGSVFKAAEKPAGWYIEQCGLKGHRIGGAMIAQEHANWIVNLGDATATDVKALINLAQREVHKKFNISLEREVEYVPDDTMRRNTDG